MKFLHAADLHIDSPMLGLSKLAPDVARRVTQATRDAFTFLIDYALREDVNFVVIAGDLFDGDWDQVASGLWTLNALKRLTDAGKPVFVVYGNHDKKSPLLKNWTGALPKLVKVFSETRPERAFYSPKRPAEILDAADAKVLREQNEPLVALTGQSYSSQFCQVDLAEKYPDAEPDAFNLGILHTGLGGLTAEQYAPTNLDVLNAKKYQYWALGHQHRYEILQKTPSWIAYSGATQARHINESEPKGFLIVECDLKRAVCEPSFVPSDFARWFQMNLDLTGLDEDELQRRARACALRVIEEADGRFAVARLNLSGRSPLFRELYEKEERNELLGYFASMLNDLVDRFWFERISLEQLKPPIPDAFWDVGVMRSVDRLFQEKTRFYDELAQQGRRVNEAAKDGAVVAQHDVEATDPLRKAVNKASILCEARTSQDPVDFNDPELMSALWSRAQMILADMFCE